MSKYKVGDKVLMEAEIVDKYDDILEVEFADGSTDTFIDRFIFESTSAYNKGLQDAWELALKVSATPAKGGIPHDDCKEIFGTICGAEIMRNNTPQQALAKIEAYEESKAIKVGDVVRRISDGDEYLVITRESDSVYEYGAIDLTTMIVDKITGNLSEFTKTGRHIDISSILEQIRGNE